MARDLASMAVRLDATQAITESRVVGAAFVDMGQRGQTASRLIVAAANPVNEAIKQQALEVERTRAAFARSGGDMALMAQEYARLTEAAARAAPAVTASAVSVDRLNAAMKAADDDRLANHLKQVEGWADRVVNGIDGVRSSIDRMRAASARADDARLAEKLRALEEQSGRTARGLDGIVAAQQRMRAASAQSQAAAMASQIAQHDPFQGTAAAILKTEKAAVAGAGGLGQLKEALVSATRATLGLNPAVAQVGGLLGTMAIGAGPMIGILAGLAALGYAWNALTEKTREAKKALEEYRESEDRRRAVASIAGAVNAAAGRPLIDAPGLTKDLEDAERAVARLRGELDNLSHFGNASLQPLNALAAGLRDGTVNADQFRTEITRLAATDVGRFYGDLTRKVATLGAEYLDLQKVIERANSAASTPAFQQEVTSRQQEIDKLRALNDAYGSGEYALQRLTIARDAEIKLQRDSIGKSAEEITQLNGLSAAMVDQQVRAVNLTESREKLQRSLVAGVQQIELDKIHALNAAYGQGDLAIARINASYDELIANRQAEISVLSLAKGLQDAELERLKNLNAQRRRETEEIALKIEMLREEAIVWAILRDTGVPDGSVGLENNARSAITKSGPINISPIVQEMSEVNEQIVRDATETQARWLTGWRGVLADWKNEMVAAAGDGFGAFIDWLERSLNGGRDAFGQFADDVFHIMTKLAAMIAALEIGKRLLPDDMAKKIFGKDFETKPYDGQYGDAARGALAGVAGAGIGYGIGHATGSGALGALGGAAGGFAVGNQILPGIGGAVGALAGLAGGIIGAGKAAREAAERMRELQESFQSSFAQYRLEVAGTATEIDRATSAAHAQSEAYRKQIEQAYAGKKFETERNRLLAENAELEARALTAAKARLHDDLFGGITEQLNALDGPIGLYRNALASIEADYAKQIELARALSATEIELAQVEELRRQRTDALVAAEAERLRQIGEDLGVRVLAAQGLDDEASAMRIAVEQRREMAKAVGDGWTTEQLATLAWVQAAELAKAATDRATEAERQMAEAREQSRQMTEDLTIRFLRLTGALQAADDAALVAQQRRERDSAVAGGASLADLAFLDLVQRFERGQMDAQRALDAQVAAVERTLKVQEAALDIARHQLEETRRAALSLASFRDSLQLGPLSTEGPVGRFALAQQQFDAMAAKAYAGDASAAAQLPELARTLLEAARPVYGSGSEYAKIFGRVNDVVTELAKRYGDQATVEERMITALEDQVATLHAQLEELRSAAALAKETQVQVIAALEKVRDATAAPADELLTALETLTATTQTIGDVSVQHLSEVLLESRNAAVTAANAQIDAIKAGASVTEIALLGQLATLESTRLDANTRAIESMTALNGLGGFGQAQVAGLETLRSLTDAAYTAQIEAIRAGASQSTIDSLVQVAALNQQRLDVNSGIAQQIAMASLIYGANSQQVQTLTSVRDQFNSGIQDQITAIGGGANGTVSAIDAAMRAQIDALGLTTGALGLVDQSVLTLDASVRGLTDAIANHFASLIAVEQSGFDAVTGSIDKWGGGGGEVLPNASLSLSTPTSDQDVIKELRANNALLREMLDELYRNTETTDKGSEKVASRVSEVSSAINDQRHGSRLRASRASGL